MISKLHERLGTAGFVISIVALVAALGGGAYAATGGLTGQQKKEVTKIAQAEAKKFAKKGPAGPEGKQGPAGAAGKDGSNGTNGSNGTDGAAGAAGAPGTNGKTVLNGTTAPASTTGEVGDFYIRTSTSQIYGPKTASGWGSPTSLLGEEGPEGQPWTAGGTLPAGATETGTYLTPLARGNEPLKAAISFTLPLASALEEANVHYILPNGKERIFKGEVDNELTFEEITSTACTGNVANPKATSGNLCIYQGFLFGIGAELVCSNCGTIHKVTTTDIGTDKSGALLSFEAEVAAAEAYGSWAVTG